MSEEERIKELAECLDVDVEDLEVSEYDESVFYLNPRLEKDGYPPQRYVNIVTKFKMLLTKRKTEQIRDFIMLKHSKRQRDTLYNTVKNYINKYKKDTEEYRELKEQTMHVENIIYHLLSDEDADHVTKYKTAYLGEPMEDDRKLRRVNDGEYLVLTDSEADQRAYDYLEDGELWKMAVEAGRTTEGLEDWIETVIAIDGRASLIASYDGDEQITDNFYIYRVN